MPGPEAGVAAAAEAASILTTKGEAPMGAAARTGPAPKAQRRTSMNCAVTSAVIPCCCSMPTQSCTAAVAPASI